MLYCWAGHGTNCWPRMCALTTSKLIQSPHSNPTIATRFLGVVELTAVGQLTQGARSRRGMKGTLVHLLNNRDTGRCTAEH